MLAIIHLERPAETLAALDTMKRRVNTRGVIYQNVTAKLTISTYCKHHTYVQLLKHRVTSSKLVNIPHFRVLMVSDTHVYVCTV